ncbi:hypothetical protein BCV70DRAFT_211278 [Testicularia cyperi]|uniref:Uncharacterized protein n=1 Tax=Testicularia cyperi TaxID=1882483 RepID=A0A317XRJ6_9BASI|nr:hypothetical protein BCV70DRAFT_211278 [Testicularia cyperi]
MAVAARRSTRRSASAANEENASASVTGSKQKASSSSSVVSTSSRSSAASSGVIPTVAARNAAKQKETRVERRLEDLLDDTVIADETRRMDVSMGAFLPVTSQPASASVDTRRGKSRARDSVFDSVLPTSRRTNNDSARDTSAGPSRAKRKLRQSKCDPPSTHTLSSRDRAATGTAPHLSRNGRHAGPSSRTVFEPLQDAAGGETPIIRRNQAFRAGLEKAPRLPTGKEADRNRRSSLGLKGQKRVSSLRDGTAAYPHDNVPDHELYRHCSADLPPVIRMKHLTGWILKRSLDVATGRAEVPVKSNQAQKKSKRSSDNADTQFLTFTDAENKLLASKKGEIDTVLNQVLTDLNEGVFGISWMSQSDLTEKKGLQPHPRNESNRIASSRLAAVLDGMAKESQAWSKELTRIEDYEAETSRLEELLASSTTELDDVIAWDRHDLSEEGLQQLRDADAAMDWLRRLTSDESEATKTKSRTKGRTSKAAGAKLSEDEFKGTDLDVRWADVEFSVDLLRSRSHQFAQLESLASRYIRTVSAHAAQALRDRTSSSSALAGAASTGSKRGRRKADTQGQSTSSPSVRGGPDRLERLLSGVRESRSVSTASQQPLGPTSGADESMAADSSTTLATFEPDESDPTDLLRALARMN